MRRCATARIERTNAVQTGAEQPPVGQERLVGAGRTRSDGPGRSSSPGAVERGQLSGDLVRRLLAPLLRNGLLRLSRSGGASARLDTIRRRLVEVRREVSGQEGPAVLTRPVAQQNCRKAWRCWLSTGFPACKIGCENCFGAAVPVAHR